MLEHPTALNGDFNPSTLEATTKSCNLPFGVYSSITFPDMGQTQGYVLWTLGYGYDEFRNQVSATRPIGVDLNPDSADMLEPGVEFYEVPTDYLRLLEDCSVDVVFTSNLLEHLQKQSRC
ncbi:class I SAM-dependent methyltransferase [Mycobacterium uberis]|uniref:class I SAM-dependent methyltransferase n=1 Tax=Mycobacterium uberis TaxID=2162698 RepID=UPI001FB3F56E|nr:class I SAM-dependent methyltransferase [Mycobacterium uberis]